MHFKPEDIKAVAKVIREGGVALFPFDTIWGLTAKLDHDPIMRITQIKRRQAQQPMIIMLRKIENLMPLVQPLEPYQLEKIEAVWPGPTTLILPKTEKVPDYVTVGRPTVGVRVPMFWPVNMLIHEVGEPIVSTSANLNKEKTAMRFEDIPEDITSQVDIAYHGVNPGGLQASALWDMTQNPPVQLR